MKDKITTLAGLLFVVSGSIIAVDGVPPKVKVACGIIAAVSGGIIGYFTGKKPNEPK